MPLPSRAVFRGSRQFALAALVIAAVLIGHRLHAVEMFASVPQGGRSPDGLLVIELRDTPYTIAVLSNVDFVCRDVTRRILRVLRP